MLQLSQLVIEPAVTLLMTDHMRVEKRSWINLGAAFFALRCSEIILIK